MNKSTSLVSKFFPWYKFKIHCLVI